MYAYIITLIPCVSRVTELTSSTPVTFPIFVHSELSNLPLACTYIISATDFVSRHLLLFCEFFNILTTARWGRPVLVIADSTMECFHFILMPVKIVFGQIHFRVKRCLNCLFVLSFIVEVSVHNTV